MRNISERDDWYFKRNVRDKFGDEYSILGYYRGIHEKILIQHNCEKCGNYQFYMRPHEFLKGQKCPYCQKHVTKTTADIKREIRVKFHGKISLISEYSGPRKKILIKCNSCGRERYIYPYDLDDPNLEACFCEKSEIMKKMISDTMKILEIPFKENYKFQNIFTNFGPQFDFMIPFENEKILIDFLDENHFKKIYYDNEKFREIKEWDKVKSEFVKLNNLYYLKINYWNSDNIIFIISELKKLLDGRKLNKKRFNNFKIKLNLGDYKNNG